ncbi:MAG: tyrosine-type recombinase/integrase [Anaerolineae bacterium]|nr:tyrosine-type recombinase/integrase [Anaerolineae bacterium]
MSQTPPDSLRAWMDYYFHMAVQGIRSEAVAEKIALHLIRFQAFFQARYGHERITTCVKRDVVAWQQTLIQEGFAPSTINNYLASLSTFSTWVHEHHPHLFPMGDPTKGIGELALPPLEPRALDEQQIQSLKNLCDRLLPFYRLKGRHWAKSGTVAPLRENARPWRDRAIVFVLLSTGLRREELIKLNLSQLNPNTLGDLRHAKRARIDHVQGKGKSQRDVFLSADARQALADYLEKEHGRDVSDDHPPLFLSARGLPDRSADGRLSPRAINLILEQIGHWHDAELSDPARHISPLRPHDLRHTFAFQLAKVTGADAYELERRLGHRSQRYIQRYTNPPEQIAASYIENF